MHKFELLRQYWENFSEHIYNYFFIITSMVGSIIGLRGEEKLPFWKAFGVFLTGNITCIMIILLVDYYWKPGVIVLSSISYFLGMIGNKVTIAFVKFVDSLIKNPKKTVKEVVEVIKSILSIRK